MTHKERRSPQNIPVIQLLLAILLIASLPIPTVRAEQNQFVYLPIVLRQLPKPSEEEPNDTRLTANGPLTSGQTYYGDVSSKSDMYDIFFIVVTKAETIHITLENPPASNIQLQLHSSTSVLPLRYAYQPPFQIDYYISNPGTYYIVVYFPPDTRIGGIYQLTATY